MAKNHKWTFKARFRARAYGWRGTALASKRLKEAVSKIRKVAKSDPVLAADGVVALMERLWPSLEAIDTSSGSLGTAVYRTLEAPVEELCEYVRSQDAGADETSWRENRCPSSAARQSRTGRRLIGEFRPGDGLLGNPTRAKSLHQQGISWPIYKKFGVSWGGTEKPLQWLGAPLD
jgi:hypothetical protein